ncbi:PRP19 non-snRNP sliceosome component required for DNA repair [Cryptosporidium canis]|uniref:Pre-mRNA-processing factor 19 n=1 Tax=Cryptosporidium canis TaxID=195482 RepID=A0A9D5DET7_9CRYT|nr:PRP19 non-snRNP sliceosome component required for DNA repair [Cryptosporidium canis]
MSLVCSISGATPEDPVITKTGYVFERRLIEEYIRCNNSCPITKGELSLDDLIPIKSAGGLKPRLIKNTSIPGILDSLRTEWDAMAMEMFQLRSELEQTKAQLTHSLYQHDAACRVIARITREKDQAISRLAEIQASICEDNSDTLPSGGGKRVKTQGSFVDIPKDVEDLLTGYSERMRPIRKKQSFPNIKPVEQVKEFSLGKEVPLKSGSKLVSGVAFNDQFYISGTEDGEILVSHVDFGAGEASSARITDPSNLGKVISISAIGSLSGNNPTQPPLHVLASFHNSNKIHIFSKSDGDRLAFSSSSQIGFNPHVDSYMIIDSLEIHPMGMHLFSNSSNKGIFSMFDIESKKQLLSHQLDENHSYSQLKPHPDGLILGGVAPSGGSIDIWDIRSLYRAASLEYSPVNNTGETTNNRSSSICFSNNGYYLLSTSLDNKIHLWDLRKSTILDSFELNALPHNANLTLHIDETGKYASCSSENLLSIFSLFNKHKLQIVSSYSNSIQNSPDNIQYIHFNQNLESFSILSQSGVIRMWTNCHT